MDIGNLSLQEGVLLSFLDRQLKLSEAVDAEEVCQAIEQAQTIHALELRGNTVGIGGGERIAQALRCHPELKRCLWSDMFTGRLKNEIPPILLSMTGAMMQAGCQITELDLSDNAFGPIGAEGIQAFLVSPSAYSLEVLKLNNNGLGAGGQIIAKCLVQCHSNAHRDGKQFKLKTFVAGRNRLENPGAKELAKAFRVIQTLEHISIPQNGIRKEGIIELADALKFNKNLKTIVFNDNTCDTDGALHIAKALSELKQLQVLDLGDCLCRSSGCAAIIGQVCDGQHKNIQMVDLSGSELPGELAVRIIKNWGDRFGSRAQLKLSHNQFGSMFEDLEEEVATRKLNVDLGSVSDDEGSASEKYSDSEEDESSSEDETRIVRKEEEEPAQPKPPVLDIVDELLSSGVGCLKVSSDEENVLSFLDRQLKLSEAADAEEVAQTIERSKPVSTLELRGNTVGIGGGERIAQALRCHPELKRCLWSDMFTGRLKNEIPPILLSMTGAMMQAGCQITELDLSDNAFGPIGAEGIQAFLVSPSAYSLEVLKLNNNGLGAGGQIIAKCLVQCHSNAQRDGKQFKLKTFVAGRNRLENPGAKELAKAFRVIRTLEQISIPQNGIRKEGIIELADALEYNPNLKTIVFNDNTCDTDGAYHIAKALTELKQLEVLDLGDCLCRSSGCASIIAQICDGEHHNIQTVDLSGSELPGERARKILTSWKQSFGHTDAELKLSHNMFGSLFDVLEAKIRDEHLKIDIGAFSDDEGSESEKYSGDENDDESDTTDDEVSIVSESVQSTSSPRPPRQDGEDAAVQERAARYLLELALYVQANGGRRDVLEESIRDAAQMVEQVAAVRRRPIPTTTQMLNNVIAQMGFGVKPEQKWNLNPEPRIVSHILHSLLAAGHLQEDRQLINYYFKV